MPNQALDITRSVFAKTVAGQQEVQSRTLKLSPIPRRLLILIDGKRSTPELASFVAGSDINQLMVELLNKGCIEAIAIATVPANTLHPAPAAEPISDQAQPPDNVTDDDFQSQLPDPSTRTAKEVEMARSIMMNTVNTVFQANTRLTLLEAIFACKTAREVRNIYPKWSETINSNAIGAKRMPEFREKLMQVL
jgi:hypothetical protein